MKLLLMLLISSAALAQTVTVAPPNGTTNAGKSWSITLRPKTVISSLSCSLSEMEPGDVATCTVTLNQAARAGGYPLAVTVPTGFTGPASLTVAAGATTATFSLTRLDVAAQTIRYRTPATREACFGICRVDQVAGALGLTVDGAPEPYSEIANTGGCLRVRFGRTLPDGALVELVPVVLAGS